MNTRERFGINSLGALLFAGALIAALVLGALAMDALWMLIGGVALVLAVLIVAGWVIAKNIVVPLLNAKATRDEMKYKFLRDMAEKGVLPSSGEYYSFRNQIVAPSKERDNVSQIIFNQNALRESAVNLLLLSMRQIGADQNRIASGPECAAAGVNGYSPRTWGKIVHEFLEPNYGVVTARGSIENGGGTFVPDAYKTVEALYRKIMTDSAVVNNDGCSKFNRR